MAKKQNFLIFHDFHRHILAKHLGSSRHLMSEHVSLKFVSFLQERRRRGEVVNQRLKQLMKELGEAINESLSEAEPIAEVIGKIKGEGYDVFLVLEATVGFNRQDEDQEKPEVVRGSRNSSVAPELKINAQDLRFLKSLRISLDEMRDAKNRAA